MPGRRVVTLQHVAAAAGVSTATVSKSLNGTGRVAPATRARVADVARELGFVPNPLARSLVGGRPSTVGMLIRDSRVERFALPVMVGAEEALSDIDLSLIVCDAHGDADRADVLLRQLDQRRVDGILVVGDNTLLHRSVTAVVAVPVVYVYHESDEASDVAHLPDDTGGAALAVDRLVATGRRRIAHVTGPRSSRAVQQRVLGVRSALARHGLQLAAPVLYGPWSQRRGHDVLARLLARTPDLDAVACGSDQIASGAVAALLGAGRRVPDDVAVTGFDNWVEFAEDSVPGLTTVDMRLADLGAAAARELFQMIDGVTVTGGVRRHPCALVVRGSTDPVRSR